jgi:hypothetical protein
VLPTRVLDEELRGAKARHEHRESELEEEREREKEKRLRQAADHKEEVERLHLSLSSNR